MGNSAFVLLIATIIPIYFNYLTGSAGVSEVNSLAYWGYAASAATIIVALIGPILGTIADTKNYKKPLFTISMMVGVIGCAALAFPTSWVVFLAVFINCESWIYASLIFMILCWLTLQSMTGWTWCLLTDMRGDTSEVVCHLLFRLSLC